MITVIQRAGCIQQYLCPSGQSRPFGRHSQISGTSFLFQMAENRLEVLLVHEGMELTGQQDISKVFIDDQYLVLVIDDLLGFASEIGKRQLMGINRQGCCKRTPAEVNILVSAPA